MNQARLDARINPISKLGVIALTFWLVVIVLIGVLASLVWWQLLLLTMVGLVVILLYNWRCIRLLNLTQMDDEGVTRHYRNQQTTSWHLLIKQPLGERQLQQNQLWQGNLIRAYDFGLLVFLRYQITEPKTQPLSIVIWQDQVTVDDWRKLKVLCVLK